MADIQRTSYNLFDKNATDTSNGYETNSYINANGETGASINHNISEYIDISGYSTLTISGGQISSYSINNTFYNTNKEKISWFPCTTMPITVNVPNNAKYIRITISKSHVDTIMLNSGTTAKPYEPYGWVHSLREMKSATETIQSGDTIYANGSPITTYSIKGNTTQSGTPTPSNPVAVIGVGERTENLFDSNKIGNIYPNPDTQTIRTGIVIDGLTPSTTYYLSITNPNAVQIFYARFNGNQRLDSTALSLFNSGTIEMTSAANTIRFWVSSDDSWSTISNIMLVEGSTAPTSYIPYGFKIPISSIQTTPIYLGSVQSTRQIQKLVLTGQETIDVTGDGSFYIEAIRNYLVAEAIICECTHYQAIANTSIAPTGNNIICFNSMYNFRRMYIRDTNYSTAADFQSYLQAQYAAGTPVTLWYVLATATTGTVNEPLMKIGDYSDSISNAVSIPTTDGANTVTIDTTVQPSEFSATWTGWHDASVQEYQGGVGNQKFDKTTAALGYRVLYTTGEIGELSTTFCSDFIPVVPNTTYTLNVVGNLAAKTGHLYALYDSDKEFVDTGTHASVSGQYVYTFTIPSEIAYIRFNGLIANIDETMLNEGSTALPYEAYQYGWE